MIGLTLVVYTLRERERETERENLAHSSAQRESLHPSGCSPASVVGCPLPFLRKIPYSVYQCALEMAEGFFLLLKQINWSLIQRVHRPITAIHFCTTSKQSRVHAPSVNLWAIGKSDKWAKKGSIPGQRCFRTPRSLVGILQCYD